MVLLILATYIIDFASLTIENMTVTILIATFIDLSLYPHGIEFFFTNSRLCMVSHLLIFQNKESLSATKDASFQQFTLNSL